MVGEGETRGRGVALKSDVYGGPRYHTMLQYSSYEVNHSVPSILGDIHRVQKIDIGRSVISKYSNYYLFLTPSLISTLGTYGSYQAIDASSYRYRSVPPAVPGSTSSDSSCDLTFLPSIVLSTMTPNSVA